MRNLMEFHVFLLVLVYADLVSHKDRLATTKKAVDTNGRVLVGRIFASEGIRDLLDTLSRWQAG